MDFLCVQFDFTINPIFEFYKIKQIQEYLKVNLQHYSENASNPISTLEGTGITKSNNIAFYYGIKNKNSSVVGCILLQCRQNDSVYSSLVGKYFQQNEPNNRTKNEFGKRKFLTKDVELFLVKDFPLLMRIKITLGIPVFKSFSDAQRFGQEWIK